MFNKLGKIFLVVILGIVFVVPLQLFAKEGDIIFTFGLNTPTMPADRKISANLDVTVNLASYSSTCGNNANSFYWDIVQDNAFNVNNSSKPAFNVVVQGGFGTQTFSRTQAVIGGIKINKTFTAYDSQGQTVNFYARIYCDSGTLATKVTQSAKVPVTVGIGELIYSCIGSNGSGKSVYICSDKNYSDCSDTVGCADQKSCSRINVSLCGKEAASPITGTGCGTPGQPACTPGQNQNYSFNIDNPLSGGVTDFTSLIKILAQWIFNLAIPIAVAMIVYSGILFLTAQGEPGKVTKAKEVLKYAVIGLAIILIGSGFITLIKSILDLGAPSSNSGQTTFPTNNTGGTTGTSGAVGSRCSNNRDCVSGLKCANMICQRETGNLVDEACVGGVSCAVGLACDLTSEGRVFSDPALGSCFQP